MIGPRPPTNETVIVAAEIAAGHDGAAEVVLSLRYPNGIDAKVVLDTAAGFKLMRNCGANSLADLSGQSWRRILDGD